jgi:ssRNA-specific RNase YbeY (16S rRNA maturation enzyme)
MDRWPLRAAMMYHIRIHDELKRSQDHERIKEAVLRIITDYGEWVGGSCVDIHLVNDAKMAKLRLRGDALNAGVAVSGWDYEKSPQFFGELYVNTDRAAREAPQNGCSVDDEVLIYVVYGTLGVINVHETVYRAPALVKGHDQAAEAKKRQLEKEAKYDQLFGLAHAYRAIGNSDDYKPGVSCTLGCLILLLLLGLVGGLCVAGVVAIWRAGWLEEVALGVLIVLCAISFGIPISEFFSRKK